MAHEALILPVGHDLGARSADPDTGWQQVRVGAEVMELSRPECVVWLLAHSLDDADRPTRQSLLEQAGRFGVHRSGADATIDRFLDDGLLAEVGPGRDAAIAFACRHQLVPLMLGLGPDPEDAGMLLLGLMNQPVVQVSPALYDLWTWAHLSPQLWAACEDAVATARRQGVTDPGELDPGEVLTGFLAAVHGLLRVRAAYLDRWAA